MGTSILMRRFLTKRTHKPHSAHLARTAPLFQCDLHLASISAKLGGTLVPLVQPPCKSKVPSVHTPAPELSGSEQNKLCLLLECPAEDNGDLTRPASWLPAQPNAHSLPTETSHAARREAAKLRACWPLLFHMAQRALQLPQVSPQCVAE